MTDDLLNYARDLVRRDEDRNEDQDHVRDAALAAFDQLRTDYQMRALRALVRLLVQCYHDEPDG